ncbi:hypothetical protein KSP39_PZI022517 [Platanthera zijinensis]|uniref:Uncharacterized protein n=1 Tax=Platanthera zijinensis TaxID=2320716 RepID=A0AAP0AWD1_9ASPA
MTASSSAPVPMAVAVDLNGRSGVQRPVTPAGDWRRPPKRDGHGQRGGGRRRGWWGPGEHLLPANTAAGFVALGILGEVTCDLGSYF